MVDAGFNVVRLAEFAWSALEPADGEFDLDWLEEAVSLAANNGIASILCTPSATPPAWLTRKHPEVLRVTEPTSGQRLVHNGIRRQYDPANLTYRKYVARINAAMAKRFGQNPAVIGWQIDNEFCNDAKNEATLFAFRAWLKDKYGTLENLNTQWSARFWSMEFFAWEDIQFPGPHPGYRHAWRSFMSDLYADFQGEQITTLRTFIDDRQWITHNFNLCDTFDRRVIARDLDFVSYDHYIVDDRNELDPARVGIENARMFGYNDAPYWIMETMPGFVQWRKINFHLEPGGTRAFAHTFLAQGAEAVVYWQWRAAPNNLEQLHGAVLQQDGEPRPVYHEIARLGQDLRELAPLMSSKRPDSPVTVYDGWLDRWAIKERPFHQDFDAVQHISAWYKSWQDHGHSPNLIESIESLPSRSKILVAPNMPTLTLKDAEALKTFVLSGGHLLLGPRSGQRDEHCSLHPNLQPGPVLAELLGAEVEEFYALRNPLDVEFRDSENDAPMMVATYAERIRVNADDTEIVATFGAGTKWLEGQPALVSRAAGKGRMSYFAGLADESALRALSS